MTHPIRSLLLALLLSSLAFAEIAAQKTPQITLEQVAEKCKDLPRDKRVIVKVARFSVSTRSAQANATFGDELATMLTSALQQTNCFRVMEMNRNVSDATSEMAFAQDGFTDGSGPDAGKMLGAQLIVTGEVTDFSEGQTSTSFAGVSVGGNKSTVGFTLKMINPQTGEVLFSRDINMKGSSSGFTGLSILGVKTAGTTQNRAVQDATQKAIIRAVEIMAEAKDKIDMPEPMKQKEVKRYTAQNCQMLRNGSPKVIILISEATTAGTARDNTTTDLARRERELELKEREANVGLTRDIVQGIFGRRRGEPTKPEETASRQTAASAVFKPVVIEQSATETELTRRFVEAGFRVVDPKVYGKMRQIADSSGDLGAMAALGLKMGAQLIITGQTISERTNGQGGMTASRARLETRVIATEDGSILATNAVSGGGIDVSEAIANKVAIRNAAENMAQYLMDRLCVMNIQFANVAPGPGARTAAPARVTTSAAPATSGNSTEIAVTNATFPKLNALAAALTRNPKVKGVKKTFSGNTGTVSVEHTGNTDELIDLLNKNPAIKFDVTGLEDGKASITLN
ncbi:CsgG/HfaB family protein [Spirosoma montaniterrae]|uniref:CsgG/HfaB family protein n=1 Tax=Spirosoma montaniterrae TaxID=1178516 RepID=UPI0018DC9D99|nr:CsgG/HfaB family protein [Spirosoma montaniterrae]